jgi:WD40 repeat protein
MSDISRDQRVQEVLHAYLEAVDHGAMPDRQALLAAHPDLRDDLAEYFADASKLERLAQSLRTTPGVGTVIVAPLLGTVRYVGDYELLEEIARGGMGVVYRARQVSLHRVVALKMILKGELAGEADVRRFQQEAEAAANLDHPNIVPIYEVGDHEGRQYFSMKLIELGPRPQDQRQCAATLARVARAVHHAHQRSILHRDLKPSNILIDRQGEPHVADFGLAKNVADNDSATRSGTIVGTPAYMAPEQARAEKGLTTAVDVWSLGAILYEWLTGSPPFRGDDAFSTLMKVANEEPIRPSSVRATIDRDLETICLKCLEKEPDRRYGSAEAVADDLERWARGEPILARPATRAQRLRKWARREPIAAAFAACSVLFVVSFLGLLLFGYVKIARTLEAESTARGREAVEHLRAEKERRAAESLRLIAQSQVVLVSNPPLALALAIEGAERAEPRTAEHNNTLLAAAELAERRRFDAPPVPARAGLRPKLGFSSVAFSPDSKTLAATTTRLTFDGRVPVGSWEEHQALVWDLGTGRLLHTLHVPGLNIVKVVFSPDNRCLATIHEGYAVVEYDDRTQALHTERAVRLWDVQTGKELHVFGGHDNRVTFAAFSRNGNYLATGGWDGNARVWETDSGKLLHELRTGQGSLRGVRFSGDGTRLLTESEGLRRESAAEAEAGSQGVVFPRERDPRLRPEVKIVRVRGGFGGWSGTGISSGLQEDRLPARLWDVATGKEIARLKLPGDAGKEQATTVASCFDGNGDGRIITGHADGALRVWDGRTGRHLSRWKATVPNIDRLYPGPGEVCVLGTNTEVSRRNPADGSEVGRWQPFAQRFGATAQDPVERHLLFVAGKIAQDHPLGGAGTLPRGTFMVPPPASVSIYSPQGVRLGLLQGHDDDITDTCFSGRRQVGTASLDGTVRVWDFAGRSLASSAPIPHAGGLTAHQFTRDGKYLFTASDDGRVRKWDVQPLRALAVLEHSDVPLNEPTDLRKPVHHVELSPDDRLVVSVAHHYFTVRLSDKTKTPDPSRPFLPVKIWDAKTGALKHALPGFTCGVSGASFSPDGKRLLTVSNATKTSRFLREDGQDGGVWTEGGKDLGVRLWDPESGTMIASLPVEFYCRAAAWGPDGRWIVTSDPLKVWDAATQKEIMALERHDVDTLGVSADGAWIVGWRRNIASGREQVVVWSRTTGRIERRCKTAGDDAVAVELSPQSDRLAIGGADGKVRLWDLAGDRLLHTFAGLNQPARALAFSVSGRWLAVGTTDGEVRLWETASGSEWMKLPSVPVRTMGFSPDERWFAVGGVLDEVLSVRPTDPLPAAKARLHRPLTAEEREHYRIADTAGK